MYKILTKRRLNPFTVMMEIEQPLIAKKARPGQFIIFRLDDDAERVPLTIAGCDPDRGAVMIIFQEVGKSTSLLGQKEAGDYIQDFVGPLGRESELDEYKGKKVAVIGGGLGTAIAYPQAAYLHKIGADVDMIVGFRNKDVVIIEEEMRNACNNLYLTTDDGSYIRKGFVSDVLREQIEQGVKYDLVIAIGPLIMMKVICDLTRPHGIKTIISMNTIMVDGTGMCGCCRISYDGQIKFACVDGPDFDGHKVDFDEAMRRSRVYKNQETEAYHSCKLTGSLRPGRH